MEKLQMAETKKERKSIMRGDEVCHIANYFLVTLLFKIYKCKKLVL